LFADRIHPERKIGRSGEFFYRSFLLWDPLSSGEVTRNVPPHDPLQEEFEEFPAKNPTTALLVARWGGGGVWGEMFSSY